MRKNKGFTLIELLAVIVILAVIALIATPIIIGIIEDSKVKANENSAYGIIDSAKYYYAQGLLKPENSIEYNTNILEKLSYNGGTPKIGSSVFVNVNGEVAIALLYGNKCYVKEYNEEKLKEGDFKNCKVKIDPSLSEVIIKGPIITTGSGLYKISDTEYRYRGGCNLTAVSPYTCIDIDPINNYISIGGQRYRIISIDSQGVKVVSEKALTTKQKYDEGAAVIATSCTSISCPRNNANNTFCQVTSGQYYGCSVYAAVSGNFTAGGKNGTVTQNSTLYDYLNSTSTDVEVLNLRDKALSATWNIGAVSHAVNIPLADITSYEKSATAQFKLGLISASDYISGSLDQNCQLNPVSLSSDSELCRNNNWLYDKKNSDSWVLNPYSSTFGYSHLIWFIRADNGSLGNNAALNGYGIRPTAYLSSDLSVKSGDGTSTNPWIIE